MSLRSSHVARALRAIWGEFEVNLGSIWMALLGVQNRKRNVGEHDRVDVGDSLEWLREHSDMRCGKD